MMMCDPKRPTPKTQCSMLRESWYNMIQKLWCNNEHNHAGSHSMQQPLQGGNVGYMIPYPLAVG